MYQEKIESIVNRLSKINDYTSEPFSEDIYKNWCSFTRNGVKFYLYGESLATYNKLLKELLDKEKWSEKFSENYVDKVLKNTIFTLLESGIKKAKENFAKICSTIETYSTEQIIYIPLGGIVMYDVENIFLGKIQIIKITESILQEIIEATKKITRTTKSSPEEQNFIIQEDSEYLSREFLGEICAIYRVVAEPLRAIELAEQETQRALDLLRYSIPILHRNEDRVRIDLSSQVPFGRQPAITLSDIEYNKNSQLRIFSYEISVSNLEILKKIRIFELSDILRKPYEQVNEFEKLLLRGIHWFARSQTQVEVENEFLNLTTCLEVFFTPEGGDPISNSIAEGVAFILSKELTERKRLKDRVKKLYKFRSKISHGGHSPILTRDVIELKSIAMKLLVRMVDRSKDFSHRQDLVNWLEDQKLC